jgi:hypothetical protein
MKMLSLQFGTFFPLFSKPNICLDPAIDVATLRRCTLRKRYHTCMLLDVAALIVRTQNVKISKRTRCITYSVTKRVASQNVKYTKRKRQKT